MTKAEYDKIYKARNSAKIAIQMAKYRETHRAEIRSKDQQRYNCCTLMNDVAKARPCVDCGGCFPAYVMDWAHRPEETKLRCVGQLKKRPSTLFKEIAKCDLVCANCHRLRTLNRQLEREL